MSCPISSQTRPGQAVQQLYSLELFSHPSLVIRFCFYISEQVESCRLTLPDYLQVKLVLMPYYNMAKLPASTNPRKPSGTKKTPCNTKITIRESLVILWIVDRLQVSSMHGSSPLVQRLFVPLLPSYRACLQWVQRGRCSLQGTLLHYHVLRSCWPQHWLLLEKTGGWNVLATPTVLIVLWMYAPVTPST